MTPPETRKYSLDAISRPDYITDSGWRLLLTPEVQKWYDKLSQSDRWRADNAFTKLVEQGNALRDSDSKRLDRGLFELRFRCEGVQRRVTYTFESSRRALTLTTFRKQ